MLIKDLIKTFCIFKRTAQCFKVGSCFITYCFAFGVPDTFLDKYNPDQFEIVGNAGDTSWARSAGVQAMGEETITRLRGQGNKAHVTANMNSLYLEQDGKILLPYSRIIIRRKK